MDLKERITDALKQVKYPGFDKDIVTLGAVDGVETSEGGKPRVSLKRIDGKDEAKAQLVQDIRQALSSIVDGKGVDVYIGGQPAGPAHSKGHHGHGHGQAQGQSLFVRNRIPGVKYIIPVTSGKGGVGKSTVAVNLAYTLSQLGNKVGVLDLDLFGPSIPKMLGTKDRLGTRGDQIIPGEAKGLKVISLGMAVDDDEAMIMRGPMVMKVLDQLISQVDWDKLDYLIVDMPPGTGDVPLSLVQKLDITGAVVVTTPQDVALIDVRRAFNMYAQTQTHILGIVENMSHYVCANCGDTAHIFGQGGGEKESERLGVPLLGSIPLMKVICEEADKGSPIFDREKNPELAKVFEELANKVIERAAEAPKMPSPEETHTHHSHGHGHDHGHGHGHGSGHSERHT
ncbi:MAG: Mrp/NBP35 family ATP-binding protein [Nitrospinota bacterium]|nr:Mrp/NBP35 family ATP-binding protein [Nitrospinota bacterium]